MCHVCNIVFNDKDKRDRHLKLECELSYSDEETLEPLSMNRYESPIFEYGCEFCYKSTPKLLCLYCNKKFKTKLKLDEEISRQYQCEFCYKTFAKKSSMDRHSQHVCELKYLNDALKNSKKCEKFVCEDCGETCYQKYELNRHKKFFCKSRNWKQNQKYRSLETLLNSKISDYRNLINKNQFLFLSRIAL